MASTTHEDALPRLILDALIHPLFWKGVDLRYLGCNRAFSRLVGLEPEAVVGLSDEELPWRDAADVFQRMDRRVLATGRPVEALEEPVRDADGQERWTQTNKTALVDEHGTIVGVLGSLVDITAQREERVRRLRRALSERETANRLLREQVSEREAMERALAESELRLRTAVRGAHLILWSLDPQGIFTFVDGGGLGMLGLRPEQIVGESFFELFAGEPQALKQARLALTGVSTTQVLTIASDIHYETRYTPVLDERGQLTGTIGLAMDVTERVRARAQLEQELERTRAQLLQVERLATLGTLAAGVGHELRNISTVLNSLRTAFTEWAQTGEAPDAELLTELGWACEHVATHGHHLMNLGQPGQTKVERVDLRELVQGALNMLRTAGTLRHVNVSFQGPARPVWTEVSRTRVEQVLINLLRNAADAVESVRDRPTEVRVCLREDLARGVAHCHVEDTGVGMTEQVLASIFEPWFTTKPPDRGTGLGLPVVRNLLRELGGDLSVESQPGQGSTFSFHLPLAPPPT
ncbi:PAS domain-containing sensor histidine kinase [Melittangium boletus]|uniref:PAS domain-containing sensor histidine kinase n=1 Tax=Melittangium boletus TaxID=83453 RepID=UPI003DA55025